MPIFRPAIESLEMSLFCSIQIYSISDLKSYILQYLHKNKFNENEDKFYYWNDKVEITIAPNNDNEDNHCYRTGWYEHIVSIDGECIGYLSDSWIALGLKKDDLFSLGAIKISLYYNKNKVFSSEIKEEYQLRIKEHFNALFIPF
jgi:hypothetical protein